jgi:hypothetical protein
MFSVPEGQRSVLSVIVWWELRRIPYNLIVGAVASVSFLLFFFFIEVSGKLEPGEDAVEPIALLFAPFAINLCYTAGWIVELIVKFVSPQRHSKMGLWLFISGLVFSLIVVCLPSTVWGILVLLQLLGVVQ